MSVKVSNDFLTINDTTTVRISEIKSIQPQSMVNFNMYGEITSRDFPKIIIVTSDNRFEILYGTDEERDKDLTAIQELIAQSTAKSSSMKNSDSININVADSSNINIVSGSSNVTINQEIKDKVNREIKSILEELEKLTDINTEFKEELTECVYDIQEKVNSDKKVPKFTLKSLLNMTSQISSLTSLGITLAQLLGA